MAGNPYTWSTTAASNASADSDVNWTEGQLPGTVNGSARGMMAGIAGWLKDTNGTLTTGGSSNAYTVTTNITLAALAQGLRIVVKANHTNTGAATLVVTPGTGSAFASKAIRVFTLSGDSALSAGMIQSGGHYELEYDTAANSTAGAWILKNPTLQLASESLAGVVELATDAETLTGTDTARAVTPANVQAKLAAAASGASWVLLRTQDASASSTIDFVNGVSGAVIDGTYHRYRIEIMGAYPATNGDYLNIRLGTGGTPTWVDGAGSYKYAFGGLISTSSTFNGTVSESSTFIRASLGVSNDTFRCLDGWVEFSKPASSLVKPIRFCTGAQDDSNYQNYVTGAGHYVSTSAFTGIRFFFNASNIVAGTFALYGLRKS